MAEAVTVKRVFVEKKKEFNIEARNLFHDLKYNLGIDSLKEIRLLNRYDISGILPEEFDAVKNSVLSEPPLDDIHEDSIQLEKKDKVFAIEYLPGQYDQRADSAAQCIQIIIRKRKPLVATARVIVLKGEITPEQINKIKKYLINPVDSREANLDIPDDLEMKFMVPEDIIPLSGFNDLSRSELQRFIESRGLAMNLEDILFCQDYFRDEEKRDPTITEIKMLDTYWSDHCRHSTFNTRIKNVEIEEGVFSKPIHLALDRCVKAVSDLKIKKNSGNKTDDNTDIDMCLMNLATLSMKELLASGKLQDLEISGEVNACSIIRTVKRNGTDEEWLIMFKNETHNHPTEIEPFGGAATCLGGAIRDPLSGRSFVYQAMRVSGSGDPRTPISDTLPGKLPQRKITTEAALGYSSYGNQIGLATGLVTEIYHEQYISKRMEVGAVIGAVLRKNVRREEPEPDDIVILVGGKTGRDGIGGATGSSKKHTEQSIYTAGAEVQKGNPPEERKLQRLFRNPDVTRLIKKSNDFGAGGVSVAIGELADGLDINLDKVPKKYEGLDGTELALSESQERMAVVISASDMDRFKAYAESENLEATEIARVTSSGRLRMFWRERAVVDISRKFINTNGVRKHMDVRVTAPDGRDNYFVNSVKTMSNRFDDIKTVWVENLMKLNNCGQPGLVEQFDSTVGAGSVLLPFGGQYQLTPIEAMVAKIPVLTSDTSTGTVMTFGYNPELAIWSPFHSGIYSVVEAITKIVATGGNFQSIRFSLQEYFEKLGDDPEKWGKPFAALLGAYYALTEFGLASIGGKDSMSGSFENIHVPPTLIAFAVDVMDLDLVVSPEFKKGNSLVVYLKAERDQFECPRFNQLKRIYSTVLKNIKNKNILSAQSVREGGLAVALSKMCFGNKIGLVLDNIWSAGDLLSPDFGSLILEIEKEIDLAAMFDGIQYQILGHTRNKPVLSVNGIGIGLNELIECWKKPLERVFPTVPQVKADPCESLLYSRRYQNKPRIRIAVPRVLITVFPGTNCEYDTQRAFENAGGKVDSLVFRNLNPSDINRSLDCLKNMIANSQIIVIPGGFSSGDEPDGSGKFITAVFRNPEIQNAVMDFLHKRDGLMIGICNGFQALIKLGLVIYGEIRELDEHSPTLTFNTIGRHVSRMVRTKVVSVLSPWFMHSQTNDIHTIPVSHGEGRFVAHQDIYRKLSQTGQIATQYVDFQGTPSMNFEFNPNGSMNAVEGITSPDGRILGKMAHNERMGDYVARNIPGDKDQKLFKSGIDYFG
jgi:phosphoribosylformylglycinamidine synthase